MDLSAEKKDTLRDMCKAKNLKGYSKLKKEDLIVLLLGAGVENKATVVGSSSNKDIKTVPKETSPKGTEPKTKETVKKPRASPTKIRVDKLNKKLEKYISGDTFKETLSTFKEPIEDAVILTFVKENTTNFITSSGLTDVDYKKYVDDHNAIDTLVSLMSSAPDTDLTALDSAAIYNKLALFIFEKDDAVYDNLVKKFKKFTVNLLKPPKEKAVPKAKTVVKKALAEGDSEEDDDSEDDEEINEAQSADEDE